MAKQVEAVSQTELASARFQSAAKRTLSKHGKMRLLQLDRRFQQHIYSLLRGKSSNCSHNRYILGKPKFFPCFGGGRIGFGNGNSIWNYCCFFQLLLTQ